MFRPRDDEVTRFRFVSNNLSDLPIKRMCELVEVPRSSFCAWLIRTPSTRERADTELLELIREIHQRSCGVYGVPPIYSQLRPDVGELACRDDWESFGLWSSHPDVAGHCPDLFTPNAVPGQGGTFTVLALVQPNPVPQRVIANTQTLGDIDDPAILVENYRNGASLVLLAEGAQNARYVVVLRDRRGCLFEEVTGSRV